MTYMVTNPTMKEEATGKECQIYVLLPTNPRLSSDTHRLLLPSTNAATSFDCKETCK